MTESNVAVILPVALEITIVAAVSLPDVTARDEATTEIGGPSLPADWPLEGERGGVGYGWNGFGMLFMVTVGFDGVCGSAYQVHKAMTSVQATAPEDSKHVKEEGNTLSGL